MLRANLFTMRWIVSVFGQLLLSNVLRSIKINAYYKLAVFIVEYYIYIIIYYVKDKLCSINTLVMFSIYVKQLRANLWSTISANFIGIYFEFMELSAIEIKLIDINVGQL